MARRFFVSLGILTVLIAVEAACVAGQNAAPEAKVSTATAKTWRAPRTPDGQPDLQGYWNFSTLTPMERPPELAGKAVLTDEEAAEYEKKILDQRNKPNPKTGGGEAPYAYDFRVWEDRGRKVVATKRTSLVVDPPDGRIPPLTPEAQKRLAAPAEAWHRPPAGPEDRGVDERCLLGNDSGPPMFSTAYMNNIQLFQTPGYVVILNEMIHSSRVIPLDGRPHGNIRQWRGESRGRWEGNTLVIDTTNFSENWYNWLGGRIDDRRIVVRANLHLFERFTRVDADTLLYEYTVDDPTTWTRPWTVQLPMTKVEGPLYEYACHEGNYGMTGILGAARAEERAAEEAAKKTKGSR